VRSQFADVIVKSAAVAAPELTVTGAGAADELAGEVVMLTPVGDAK